MSLILKDLEEKSQVKKMRENVGPRKGHTAYIKVYALTEVRK